MDFMRGSALVVASIIDRAGQDTTYVDSPSNAMSQGRAIRAVMDLLHGFSTRISRLWREADLDADSVLMTVMLLSLAGVLATRRMRVQSRTAAAAAASAAAAAAALAASAALQQ